MLPALLFLLICSLCICDGLNDVPIFLNNVECGSYVDYIPVDEQFFRYMPYYVQLHRCHGANQIVNPQNRECVPKDGAIKNISILAIEILTQKQTVLTLKNYTSCDEKCRLNSSSCTPYQVFDPEICFCECNYTDIPIPNPCKAPFVWDRTACNCVCPYSESMCEERKELSKQVCGCVCKQKYNVLCANQNQYIDQTTCGCINLPDVKSSASIGCRDGVNWAMLAVIMLIEACFIIAAYFVLYVYCYKYKYLKMKNSEVYVVKHSSSDNEINCEEPINEEPAEEVSLQKRVSYPNNQNGMAFYSDEEKSHLRTNGFEPESYIYNDVEEVEDSLSGNCFSYSSKTQV
ncbi:uncharacterized protein LOC105845530 isoform X1 [Hydra vulgaris]|uniref:uncharacterized protein LOC105845530 isoform X1 n=1 Tax=Hydra vulgaris TaxID=6087 RepID=UPI000640DFA4|nr:uncharacterized protein LOC105845530 [Hydra vulgaris]